MTDEQQHKGGVVWEARTALTLVWEARAAGDTEGEELGWLRYAEALTNASYSGAAAAFIGIHTQAEQQRQKDAKAVFDLLKGLQDGQAAMQAGFQEIGEAVSQQITALDARVTGVEIRFGEQLREMDLRHGAQWERAMARLDISSTDRQQLNERVADLLRRIVAIETRLGLASEAP